MQGRPFVGHRSIRDRGSVFSRLTKDSPHPFLKLEQGKPNLGT